MPLFRTTPIPQPPQQTPFKSKTSKHDQTEFTMSLPPPRLYDDKNDRDLLPQLAQIQAACIEHDHQLATFLPPLGGPRILEYWKAIAKDAANDKTAIILQFAESSDKEVIGYVCLMMPVTETGPFRGEVNKLMVSPDHRRKGVARRVMEKLENVARERKRWLLVCLASSAKVE